MTPTTHQDQTARPVLTLRRAAALTAIAAFGLLTPAVAGAAPNETPPTPIGPDDLTTGEPGPDDECNPLLASCDITVPEPDPEDCPPPAATCDLTAGEPDPGDPEDPDDPADPGSPSGVDAPVVATPNFTG
jgi:hypothetical protein